MLTVYAPVSLHQITAIIFDLGGVIINIDYDKMAQAMQKLSSSGATFGFSQSKQTELFDQYEKGEIDSDRFRERLRATYHITASNEELDEAWNSILLDIPQERIDLLLALGSRYRLFLLSNTNAIHMLRFNQMVADSFAIPDLDSLFEKTYYSHLVGLRKPDAAVFERILLENNLSPASTLFIDDSIQHIESARKLGIQTLHLAPPLTINNALAQAL